MIRIEGTRIELWTLPQQVGVLTGPNGDTLTPAQARKLATQLLRAANEAEQKVAAPMTGAEALDAAATPEEWAATVNGIFGAFAKAARDAED